MAVWTRESLIQYRKQMEWDEVDDDLIDQILEILNSAHETLKSLDDVSWAEPDIGFRVKTKCE